jgi:hypothetical protein
VENSKFGVWTNIASTTSAYPLDKIDLLFAMLRLVSYVDTGYAQLLLEPLNWTQSYEADLPPLQGTSIRKYPATFESFYWNRTEVAQITTAMLNDAADVYRRVMAIGNEKLMSRVILAMNRLNYCLLRESEEDAILDATSAMEALLTSGDDSEITHKLATRLAALARFARVAEPANSVFRNVKQVYAHRSNVIHGNIPKLKKSKEIRLSDTETAPTVKFATNYLRLALRILIQYPQYLTSSRIDEELLLSTSGIGAGEPS